ncbi:MAG: response regulator [Gammaproteobacteria bacterium]|nr:response regulator [Gammaproteobacteria bacterium]
MRNAGTDPANTEPSIRLRDSQEFQSALIRLAIWLLMIIVFAVGKFIGDYTFSWEAFAWLFAVHLAWYGGMLVSVLKRPRLWPARTYLGILADLSGTTGSIYLTGDATGPYYLLYAVCFLSQGMRYGSFNLLVASVGSLLAFGSVAALLGDWRDQALEVFFIGLVLVVLPAYEYVLLRKLQVARLNAETANRARGDFLASMTHELRTPLSGVIGMSGLLGRTRLDDEQREYVESINTSANVLQGLIGEVLDLSKIDAGKLELRSRPFALRESIVETCWALSSQAVDKGLELVCSVTPDVPQQVSGDELRFRQVLFNLVGNAIKFTEQGHVVVRASLAGRHRANPNGEICLEISDTGIGIPADRLGQVFDSFWQADLTSKRRHGGTGLGTAIARNLCRLMGGDITVRSTEGGGTTFTVRLPLCDAQLAEVPQAPPVLRGTPVLLLEPNAESARAIEACCVAAGMTVETIAEPAELPQAVLSRPNGGFGLALVADTPTGRDLADVLSTLTARLGYDLPMVFLHYPRRRPSVPGDVGGRALKPVLAAQLWRTIAAQLDPATVTPNPPTDESPANAFVATAQVLVAEDDPINARLISSLLRKEGCEVTLVEDGEQALAMTHERVFDLAFIDMRMPRMDGLDFVRNHRAREVRGSHLPVIGLTANASEEAREACLRAGMDEFVVKPIDPATLQELILRYGLRTDAG